MADDHAAHVADADRLPVDVRQHELIEVRRLVGLAVQEHLELQRAVVQAAHGAEPVVLGHAVGHVGQGKPGGHQPLGIDFDDDLADVAALHGDVVNVVDARDPRAKLVIGIVVQGRRDRARR